jgi:membrane protein implicated in regulation of membrane protease activity
MLTAMDARRRWFGTFFLIVAGGLLLWGLTFLGPLLVRNPLLFVTYWLTCFGLTIVSFAIAIYDLRVMRRRMREEQKTAFDKAFRDIIEESRSEQQ